MSNRRNTTEKSRLTAKAFREAVRKSLPHGTKLRTKKLRLNALRHGNLAAASRHMMTLEEQLRKGVTTTERGTKRQVVLVRQNPYAAELMKSQREQIVQLAESLRRLR
jgi:hypothetical protein